jgi:hypothetical protein
MKGIKRQVALFIAAGLVLAGIGLLAIRYLAPGIRDPRRPSIEPDAAQRAERPGPEPDARVEPPPPPVRIVDVLGRVERRTKDQPWALAHKGETLGIEDALRTGKRGSADLQIGDRSKVTVTRSTEVTVKEITKTLHRFRLERGRLSVDYQRDGSRVLRIESSSEAIAQTQEGRFSVLRTPKAISVATETGVVDLSAHGRTVKVQPGEQATAQDGAQPSPAMAIPKRVLMRIAGVGRAPEKVEQRFTDVKGETQPGNLVFVRGRAVPVDEKGRFVLRVPLAPGENKVHVEIEDPKGRRRARVLEYFVVISKDPIKGIKIRWHKKKS